MRFRVTTKEVFRRSGIVCEVSEDNLFKLSKRGLSSLPPDYWEFLPKDSNIDESCLKPSRRILTHAQVCVYTSVTYVKYPKSSFV